VTWLVRATCDPSAARLRRWRFWDWTGDTAPAPRGRPSAAVVAGGRTIAFAAGRVRVGPAPRWRPAPH
jgi:hypothetical protein